MLKIIQEKQNICSMFVRTAIMTLTSPFQFQSQFWFLDPDLRFRTQASVLGWVKVKARLVFCDMSAAGMFPLIRPASCLH